MGNDVSYSGVDEGRIKCAKVNENYESKQMFEGRISLRSTKSCLANEPIAKKNYYFNFNGGYSLLYQ